MDVNQFKGIVTEMGGEAKLMAIIFDNASRKIFTEGEYTHTKYLKESNQYFIFDEQDARRNPFKSVKLVEDIQGLIFSDDNTEWTTIDLRLIGS